MIYETKNVTEKIYLMVQNCRRRQRHWCSYEVL